MLKIVLQILLTCLLGLPLFFICLHTILRIVRHFHKFPIPHFLADAIDNPLRRRIQPPDATAVRHGIQPGMRVLEIGPGSGTYTLAAARRLGETGSLVTVDIEPRIIARVANKIATLGIRNIQPRLANVYDLPFPDAEFDLVYMIAVIGEIPEPAKALVEFRRVLKPQGKLVFSELLLDPDYPLSRSLIRLAAAANFQFKQKLGNFFYYTLVFEK